MGLVHPMSSKAASDSRSLVVDMVSDVCRVEGFSVEKNVQANSEEPLFVDIVASRRARRKTQKVAFECFEGDREVNGREVERFVNRLRNLGLKSGVYVSPKGFTGDAEFIARKLGIELWDLAKLREHLGRIKPPEGTRVPGTLPVHRGVSSQIFSSHLANGKILRMAALPKLEFRPYYFARFEAKSGKKKSGMGVLVLDGVDGRVCDAGTLEGHLSDLPSTGLFVECLEVEPVVGSMPSFPPELQMKDSVTIAPAGVSYEKVKAIVDETLRKEAGFDPESFKVSGVSLLHVPIVTVEMAAGQKSYRKILQAATAKMIWDDTWTCSFCKQPSKALCEFCGGTICDEHIRICSSCQKHVCTSCAKTKGLLSKQPLCPECKKS